MRATPPRVAPQISSGITSEIPNWINSRVDGPELEEYVELVDDQRFIVANNRGLGPHGLVAVFIVISGFSALVAGFSLWQGNVFAPFFWLLDIAIVGAALRYIDRSCRHHDHLDLVGSDVLLTQIRGRKHTELKFPLAWVSAHATSEQKEMRIWFGSHGKYVEIGSFLNNLQRERLFVRLMEFLDLAKSRPLFTL